MTIGSIVNRRQRLPTHCIYSSRTEPKWRSYFISPIHIFHLSCRLSFSPCCILSLSILFYRVMGNEIQRESEREGAGKTKMCVYCRALQQYSCVGPRGRARWPSPWSVCIATNMLRLTYTKTCTRDLSGCARHIVNLVLKGPETYRFNSLINIEPFFINICVMWKKLQASCIFQQTMDMLEHCPFMFSVFCCVYDLWGFRHKNHLVQVRKISCFGLKYS